MSKKNNMKALFKLGYGLYVVTSNDGSHDNAMISNTVFQVAESPNRIVVTINKNSYSHYVISGTEKLNVNILTESTPFDIFKSFGFKSGRDTDKFAGVTPKRSKNGLVVIDEYINSYMSLSVEDYLDLGTHGMFICTIDEAAVINDEPTMTYAYYQEHVKPKSNASKGWVCSVCGYIFEGENIPDDFICPTCGHDVTSFELIE